MTSTEKWHQCQCPQSASSGRTPLHCTSERGCEAATSSLLESGAGPSNQGNNGWAPLVVQADGGTRLLLHCCWRVMLASTPKKAALEVRHFAGLALMWARGCRFIAAGKWCRLHNYQQRWQNSFKTLLSLGVSAAAAADRRRCCQLWALLQPAGRQALNLLMPNCT